MYATFTESTLLCCCSFSTSGAWDDVDLTAAAAGWDAMDMQPLSTSGRTDESANAVPSVPAPTGDVDAAPVVHV